MSEQDIASEVAQEENTRLVFSSLEKSDTDFAQMSFNKLNRLENSLTRILSGEMKVADDVEPVHMNLLRPILERVRHYREAKKDQTSS